MTGSELSPCPSKDQLTACQLQKKTAGRTGRELAAHGLSSRNPNQLTEEEGLTGRGMALAAEQDGVILGDKGQGKLYRKSCCSGEASAGSEWEPKRCAGLETFLWC